MRSLKSRVTIEGRVNPGESAVFRIVIHGPVTIQTIAGRVRDVRAPRATIVQCAVYGTAVLKNGWKPYEQPSPCAYLPLDYSDLKRKPVPQFGAAFVERRVRHGDFQTFVIDGDSDRVAFLDIDSTDVRVVLTEICTRLGLEHPAAARVATTMQEQFSEITHAA